MEAIEMKRWLILFLLLVAELNCNAQFGSPSDLAFWGVSNSTTTWNPTNNSDGTTLLAWYVAGDYTTNTGVATWPDRTANHYDLTNRDTAGFFPSKQATELNGLPTLAMKTTFPRPYLTSDFYTSSIPHEVIIVANHLVDSAGSPSAQYLVGGGWSAPSTAQNALVSNGAGSLNDLQATAGTIASFSNYTTNKWFIIDIIFLGSSSACYTNGTAAFTGQNTGSQNSYGLTLGGRYGGIETGGYHVAEVLTYGGSNPNTTVLPGTNTTWRYNTYNYLTNKYAIAP